MWTCGVVWCDVMWCGVMWCDVVCQCCLSLKPHPHTLPLPPLPACLQGDDDLSAPLILESGLAGATGFKAGLTSGGHEPYRCGWWSDVTLPILVVSVGVGTSLAGLYVAVIDILASWHPSAGPPTVP